MESSAVLRSFQHSFGTASRLNSFMEMRSLVSMNNAAFSNLRNLTFGDKLMFSVNKNRRLVMLYANISEDNIPAMSNDSQQKESAEKNPPMRVLPDGLEALITEVCDETEIAELKLKMGDFELYLKRKIEVQELPPPVISYTPPALPPPPRGPVIESPSSAPPTLISVSSEKINPFKNDNAEVSAKLAALEASVSGSYVIVSSPAVGSFLLSRNVKGNKLPPICKVGAVIKEGQTIGFVDQFGTELAVKSNVTGEVLKILYNDGDAVGYGDPLVAVLPSFPGINID